MYSRPQAYVECLSGVLRHTWEIPAGGVWVWNSLLHTFEALSMLTPSLFCRITGFQWLTVMFGSGGTAHSVAQNEQINETGV